MLRTVVLVLIAYLVLLYLDEASMQTARVHTEYLLQYSYTYDNINRDFPTKACCTSCMQLPCTRVQQSSALLQPSFSCHNLADCVCLKIAFATPCEQIVGDVKALAYLSIADSRVTRLSCVFGHGWDVPGNR